MRATEFIAERLDYQAYVSPLKNIITNAFYDVVADDEYDDVESKINDFFYRLQEMIDSKVLAPMLKANPMVYNGVQIRSLTVSFEPMYTTPVGKTNLGAVSANVQRAIRSRYPGVSVPANAKTNAQYLKSHLDFTKEATFHVDASAKSAIINIEIHAGEVASHLFNSEQPEMATASLSTLTYNIIGKIMHEVKHFVQTTKVAAKGKAGQYLNRHFTGDPHATQQQKRTSYEKTNSGYWLNTDEMDAFAANAAAELANIFGRDTAGIHNYLNAVSKGQTIVYNGVPVNTTMNGYYAQVFNKRYKVNTDRNEIWKRYIKNVYKDLAHYLNTSQKQPAKPQ
jgi:hypothetical protein